MTLSLSWDELGKIFTGLIVVAFAPCVLIKRDLLFAHYADDVSADRIVNLATAWRCWWGAVGGQGYNGYTTTATPQQLILTCAFMLIYGG